MAIAAMALLAVMSWRGLDSMVRAQTANRTRADAVLTLQAALAQWNADLDAVVQLDQTTALDWDGQVLRLTRHTTGLPADAAEGAPAQPAVAVVAWTLRAGADGSARWRRWQSSPITTHGAWQQAWELAANWASAGGDAQPNETALMPLAGWQLLYFRSGAWGPAVSASALGGLAPLPDGVRLVLNLPGGEAGLAGQLVSDWVRPTLTQPKS